MLSWQLNGEMGSLNNYVYFVSIFDQVELLVGSIMLNNWQDYNHKIIYPNTRLCTWNEQFNSITNFMYFTLNGFF